MGVIDREEARTWSKERIREELTDLRRFIAEEGVYVRSLEATISEMTQGYEKLEEKCDNSYKIISEAEEDITYLKSIL